jgi:hypothetical protein
MPSSYTPSLKLILQATGENNGSWGTLTNSDFTSLVDVAVAGYVDVPFTSPGADQTLSNGDGAAANQARYAYINMSSAISAARNVIVPTASKIYLIKNSTTGGFAITVKTAAGTGISVPNGKAMLLLCDGTNVVDAVTAFGSGLNVTGNINTNGTAWIGNSAGASYQPDDGVVGGSIRNGGSFYITTAATERLRIDASGNLGIGTASPSTWGSLAVVKNAAGVTTAGVSNSLSGTGDGAKIGTYFGSTEITSLKHYWDGSAFHGQLYSYAALEFLTGVTPTTRMTLDASGNLGIGTASPAQKLALFASSANVGMRLSSSGGAGRDIDVISNTAGNLVVGSDLQANIATFDGILGNLGLGVTPGTWSAAAKAIEFAYPTFGMDSAGKAFVSFNGRNSSGTTWVYKSNDPATLYTQSASHTWYNAASGTAGNPITFTQAMTLDSDGNLLIGGTTATGTPVSGFTFQPAAGFSTIGVGHTTAATTGTGYAYFAYNSSAIGSITQSGTTAVLYNTTSDYRLKSNQQPLTDSGAFIDALKPTSFIWTSDGRKDVGFIAHEFQEVAPNSVTGVKDEVDGEGKPKYQAMQASSAEVIANLVAELQSLRKRIAVLEAK